MATAEVHCPNCDVDTSFEYPDDFVLERPRWQSDGADGQIVPIRWEHGCPPVDEEGALQGPYKGVFLAPVPAEEVEADLVLITERESGEGASNG